MKRPLVWVAAGWAAGLYAAMAWGWTWQAAVLLLPVAVLLWRPGWRVPHVGRAAVFLLFFAVAVVYGQARRAGPPGDPLARYAVGHPNTSVVLEGTVRQSEIVLKETTYTRFVLDAERLEEGGQWQSLAGGVFVRWSAPTAPVFAGARVRVQGRLATELGPVNHGLWRIEDHLRASGVHTGLHASGDAVKTVAAPAWSPRYWAARLRHAQALRFERALPANVLPFALAVWLGDRGGLTSDEHEAYVHSGTAHILAVSGIHMSIVFASIYFILGLARVRERRRIVITIAAVFLFALAAGARIPSLRAAIMISLYLSAGLVRRDPDAPTALGISAFLFLFVRPALLLDTGFLLSFASVASILLFAGPLAARLRMLPRAVREPLGASASVQLLPLPIAIHAFHVLPIAAPLANLAVVPLLGAALWLCFLTSVLAFIAPPLALLSGHALAPVVWAIRAVAAAVANTPLAYATLTSPAVPAAVLYWAALACLVQAGTSRARRLHWAAAAAAAAIATVLLWNPWRPLPTVDFLDVGHADAALVRTAGGDTVLIDGGVRSRFRDDGAYVVTPFLHAHHVRRVDYLVATHAEADHMGGLLHVVERVPVGCVLLPAATPAPEKERPLLERCAARGIPVHRMARGEAIELRGARLEALHPPANWQGGRNINDYSLVLRLVWSGPSVLFAGDVEAPAERVLAAADTRAAILKVSHHGSATSSTEAFLRAVDPGHAVISTRASGRGNAVAPAVERRLAEAGITVWRTDHHGGLRLAERDGAWVFEGARTARGYR